MVKKFSSIVVSKTVEPFWSEIALTTQKVMDAAMASAAKTGAAVPL